MTTTQRNSKKQSYFARVKHELENQSAPLQEDSDFKWDPCDERFLAPALLNRDGSLNTSLLFDFGRGDGNNNNPALTPGDRRYILRQMEAAREKFLDNILETSRKKKAEEQRKVEEAEDQKEMRLVKERLSKVSCRLTEKQHKTAEHVAMSEQQALRQNRERAMQRELEFCDAERKRIAELEKRREELPPDFPTTFSVTRRLHPSPPRQQQHQRSAADVSDVVVAGSPAVALRRTATAGAARLHHHHDASFSSSVLNVWVRYDVARTGELLPVTEVL